MICLRFICLVIINIHMTISISGPLSLSEVNTEVGAGASATINLGGANTRLLAGIAAPGQIRMSDLRGRSLRGAEYFTATTVYTVASGVTFLRFIVVGAGGAAGVGFGSGGGAGGQVINTGSFAVIGGDTVAISVGVGTSTRGGNTSVTNNRTGQSVTARGGFAGFARVGITGGSGGISFSQDNNTQYGGLGSTGTVGGGGAGAGGVGAPASASTPGAGANPLFVQINSTQTVYLSPGGRGIDSVGGGGVTLGLYGAGSSELGVNGRSGVVILY